MIVTFHKLTAMTGRLLAVAAAAVAVFYGRAWQFDLHCDELLFIRPWSAAELTGVFHGTWEPQGVASVFFRPLTSWFFAGTFELFGVSASAHLVLSLALLAAVTFLLALFVARESGSGSLGALTAIIYAIHPNNPWSAGVWVMNDFHKLAALIIFSALLLWRGVRHRPTAAWWPLLLLAAAAFLIKEDNIVLIPALLTLQWLRARWANDVRAPTRGLWAIGATFSAALWTGRWLALQRLGGLPLPSSIEAVARNLVRGPFYVLIGQVNTSDGVTLAAALGGALAAGVIAVAIARLPREQRWVPAVALIVMAWYVAPLALASGITRYYVVTLCGSILLAHAVFSLWTHSSNFYRRAAVAVLVGAVSLVAVRRQQALLSDFAVCGRLPMQCRNYLLEDLPALPPEMRAFTMNMPASCRAGERERLDQSDSLTWGLGGLAIDTMSGGGARAAGPHIVALLRASAATATMRIRHPDATSAAPIDVSININGRDVTALHLTSPDWTAATVALTGGWRTWLRGMHRSDIRVTSAGAERGGAEWQPWVARQ